MLIRFPNFHGSSARHFCAVALMLLAIVSSGCARRAKPNTVASPNGKLRIEIKASPAGGLTWEVARQGRPVLAPAPLGLTVDGQDLGQGVTLGAPTTRTFHEEYPIFGNHRTAVSRYTEAVFPVRHAASGINYELAVRAFDDGAALSYNLPLQGKHTIAGEATAWAPPPQARAWWAKYGYEQPCVAGLLTDIPSRTDLSPPLTFGLGGNLYVSITEANNAAFPDMGLRRDGTRLVASFPACKKGWTVDGPIVTPWRTAVITDGLTALVNSDLLTNLCPPPPPELAHAAWIRPGRALWQWWSIGEPMLNDQRQWIDAAKKLGFEYYLIDDGWRVWSAPGKDQWQCLKDVIDYGKSQGVACLVWVNSKEMRTAPTRRAYLEKVAALGAAGIKIDFIPPATPQIMKWYEGALADTAELKLLCNFHGSVKPTGRQRTWPHELNREAVRGHEWHMTRYKRIQAADHDVTIPFLRFLAGPADFTPTAFDPAQMVGYTWAHLLAQSIVLSAPLLHFADQYKYYIGNPAEDLLRVLPTTWDETIVLPGTEIGKTAAFARRCGDGWFIGVLNGGENANLKIDLKFLGAGAWSGELFGDVAGKADAFKKESRTLKAGDTLPLELGPRGGFVAYLKKAN